MTGRRSASAARSAGRQAGGSLNLIHRNKVPAPMLARLCGVLTPAIRAVRPALYAPLDWVAALPGGPVRHMALLRATVAVVVAVDSPLRAILLRGAYEPK